MKVYYIDTKKKFFVLPNGDVRFYRKTCEDCGKHGHKKCLRANIYDKYDIGWLKENFNIDCIEISNAINRNKK